VVQISAATWRRSVKSGGKGTIHASVRRAAGDVEMAAMTITDSDFKAKLDAKRHGLRRVEQVHGTAMVDSDHGRTWTIGIYID